MNEQSVKGIAGQLPEVMLIELGRIVVAWTALEHLLVEALERLAGMDRYMDAHSERLFRKASFSQRLQVFGAYCGELAKEYPSLRSYRNVMEKLQSAYDTHSGYIRSRILYNPETGQYERSVYQLPDAAVSIHEKVGIADLQREASTIAEAHESLSALLFGSGTAAVFSQSLGA